MALKKCRECGYEVSTKAVSCPKCGAVVKKKMGCLGFIVVVFLIFIILIILGVISSSVPKASNHPTPTPSVPTASNHPMPAPEEPKLLLLNWSWHEEYEYAIVEGEVQNISSENLRNVEVVASFYTVDSKFITSADALIGYNPILPGQTSPFKAMTSYNPSMESATITFKTLMGGSISWKKKE